MKPRTCIAALSLSLVLLAEPVTAQNPVPERGTSLAFGFADGATVGVWVPAGPRWDVGVEFSARWVETDEDESLENRTRGFTAAVPLKRYLDVDGSVVPFLVFGPFVEHSRTRISFAESSASSRRWRTGGRFGVGLDWFVADRVSIGGHAGAAAAYLRETTESPLVPPLNDVEQDDRVTSGFTVRTLTSGIQVRLYFR